MFEYSQELHFDLILPKLKFISARQILMELSHQASNTCAVPANALYDLLISKENAEGSGIGDGVSIAHATIKGLKKPCLILATLARDITDFKSPDNLPVSIAALILSPESEGPLHLRRLSRLSRLLKNDLLHKRISEARDEISIRALLMDPEGWMLVAA